MKTEICEFLNSNKIKLAGKLDLPDDKNVLAYGLFAHCFTCSSELKAIANINSVLTKYGIAVLRFDMTGIGSSEGIFCDTNFTTQIDDIISASKFLEKNFSAPRLLIGHSLGGSAVLFATEQIKSAKAIVTIASPDEPSRISKKLKRTKHRAIKYGITETEIGGVKFQFKPQFFSDIEKYNCAELQKKIKLPYLVMHSPADTYSDAENAINLFSRANFPKNFITLDKIDHLILNQEDAFYIGNLIAVWALRYL
jgi:putative redox protein